MQEVKNNRFWLSATEDFRRFRKGEISQQELMQKYPEFDIRDGWRMYAGIKEAVRIIIPEDCPLPMIPQIVRAVMEESNDVNMIQYDIRIAYQPVWETLPQRGYLKNICAAKKPVVFRVSYEGPWWRSNEKPCIDMRYCVREGSHGDEDGYGIEDDTWLVGLLKLDGTWLREWYIED